MVDRPDLVTRIRHLRTSREALEEAGRLRRLQRSDWFDVNVGIMDDILYAKFTQHPRLKASLLGTGERELIEDSPVRYVCEDRPVIRADAKPGTGRLVLGLWK